MAKTLVVAAPVVLLKVNGRIEYLYINTEVPEQADKEQLQRLIDMGMVVSIGEDEALPPTDTLAAPAADTTDYSAMEYGELQAAAKERGIKPNQSRGALVAALSA